MDAGALTAATSGSTHAALRFMRQLQRRPGGGRTVNPAADTDDTTMPSASPAAVDESSAKSAPSVSGVAGGAASQGGGSCPPATPVRQLTRLTLATDDAASAAGLSIMHSVTSSYDILAIQPLSERVLLQVGALISQLLPVSPLRSTCFRHETSGSSGEQLNSPEGREVLPRP